MLKNLLIVIKNIYLGGNMLEICDICKEFGTKKALNDINFSVSAGEIVALLGENGAGKSTLLRIISGFLEVTCGKVKFDKLEMQKDRLACLQKLGYVQEISSLYGDMSVFEFLLFEANIRQIKKAQIDNKIIQIVNLLELKEVVNQKIDTLSKGFKKRVELAAVLLSEPQILLLDEPTEGLDPNQKEVIRKIIINYAIKHTIIISTHTMEDVEALASRVFLIHNGTLQTDAKLTVFKKSANHDLLVAF